MTQEAEKKKSSTKKTYNIEIGNLRSFIIFLVLLHHSLLAYFPDVPAISGMFSELPKHNFLSPIIDSQRWAGMRPLIYFDDNVIMALMFLVSGLFVWLSLKKRGTKSFLEQRFLRLGIPFIVLVLILSPITYYAMYLQTTTNPSIADYVQQLWLRKYDLFLGHSWFIWVLLIFDITLIFIPARLMEMVQDIRPSRAFLLLIALSFVVYYPLAQYFGPYYWSTVGVFNFQTSRILHYFVYFLMGVGIGMSGLHQSFLHKDSDFPKQWGFWSLVALLSWGFSYIVYYSTIDYWILIHSISFILFNASASFALMSLFLRFGGYQNRWSERFNKNSFGMYIFHYVIVIWLQYLLLGLAILPILKAGIVFTIVFMASWTLTALLRRIPIISRII